VRSGRRQEAEVVEGQDVGQVGQPEPLVEQVGVGHLGGEPHRHQLLAGRRPEPSPEPKEPGFVPGHAASAASARP